jgi:hypothetical protein
VSSLRVCLWAEGSARDLSIYNAAMPTTWSRRSANCRLNIECSTSGRDIHTVISEYSDVSRAFWKLHNGNHNNLYPSQNNIRVNKSLNRRWADRVELMGRWKTYRKYYRDIWREVTTRENRCTREGKHKFRNNVSLCQQDRTGSG